MQGAEDMRWRQDAGDEERSLAALPSLALRASGMTWFQMEAKLRQKSLRSDPSYFRVKDLGYK